MTGVKLKGIQAQANYMFCCWSCVYLSVSVLFWFLRGYFAGDILIFVQPPHFLAWIQVNTDIDKFYLCV